jgi:hypothetical protein
MPAGDMDLAHNVAAFTEAMFKMDTIPEGQRNRETYIMAARGRDLGLSREMVGALMLAHWLDLLDGEFSPTELSRTVDSVYKTARNQPGCAAVEAMFPDDGLPGDSFDAPAQKPKKPFARSMASVVGKKIPRREWVLGTRCIRGFVDVLIATGGSSKSTITMTECISICSGKPLTGDPVHLVGPCLYINAEDPDEEIDRRTAALERHFNLGAEDLEHFYARSGYGEELVLVKPGQRGGYSVNAPLIREIIEYIQERGCVRVVFDPMVRFHNLDENDNSGMDVLMRVFARIAAETKAAVSLMHHTNKGKRNGDEGNGDANLARGAGAIIAAARIAHTMGVMGQKEAKKCGISEKNRPWFIRLDDAKGNMSAPNATAKWYQRVSVDVDGESVGVVQPVDLNYIEELKGDDLALGQAVCDVLATSDTDEMSVYEIVKIMVDSKGMYPEVPDAGDRALRRMVTELFDCEREIAGRRIRPVERKKKGRTVACLILDEE